MKLVDISTSAGTLRVWDLVKKVGKRCPNSRIDVKFCQFMLYKVNRRLLVSDVDGIWGPKSASALAGWEKGGPELTADGIIDVVPAGGNGAGTISKKVYKIVTFQAYYVSDVTGIKDLRKCITYAPAIQEVIMKMPEDCKDMPSDLSHDMIRARDEVFA